MMSLLRDPSATESWAGFRIATPMPRCRATGATRRRGRTIPTPEVLRHTRRQAASLPRRARECVTEVRHVEQCRRTTSNAPPPSASITRACCESCQLCWRQQLAHGVSRALWSLTCAERSYFHARGTTRLCLRSHRYRLSNV